MGEVYLAEDTQLDRKVAIKFLPEQLMADERATKRLIREAHAVAALDHSNICSIYEVGQDAGHTFIVMQYVEGETLADRLARKPMELQESLTVALQVADALAEAHSRGIIHRDIKPQNIMLTARGQVKVLDFGLAKVAQAELSTDSEAVTQSLLTQPGIIVGTVQYMSPEQLKGETLDSRSDIFSFGVVLYEMMSGHHPFAAETPAATISSTLTREPLPLARYSREAPPELERIVSKALRKDREERYQGIKDLALDLKSLKEELEFEVKLERSLPPDTDRAAATGGGHAKFGTADHLAIRTDEIGAAPESLVASVTSAIRSHKRGAAFAAGLLVIAVAAVLFFYFKPTAALTDKDTILLAEFDNNTGEAVFDRTLRQGLAVQLRQSPFLDLFPDTRVRATLRLMNRSPDERVTRESGREICQRQGLKALIAGSIAKFDRSYSITLEALNGQTGDGLALVQVEAEEKDQVLKALSRAATELREKLGESLSSIRKFDAPLEVTTSSLEALKEFALGQDEAIKGQSLKAIEFYRRATEKDPNFAYAWAGLAVQHNNTSQPGLAAEYAAKAFALRDRVSEDEKARITFFYYTIVTGELDKSIEEQESYMRNYPRDNRGPGNLGVRYAQAGQTEKAVAAVREALRLNPNSANWHSNLAEYLMRLNRFVEAGEVCRRAIEQKLDSTNIRSHLYSLAFVNGDAQVMREQIAWASGKPDEYVAVDWQTQTATFAGEWRKSQDFLRRATELALRNEAKEVAAGYTAEQALRAAWLGSFAQAVTLAEAALKIERNRPSLTSAALALALAGDAAQAQPLVAELEQKHPKDTLVNQLWLPATKAALEIRKGSAQTALELLEPARRYEPAAEFWPQTVRSLAYLKLGKGAEAAAEYRKILDHRGEGARSLLWPLAHLGLARAAALSGDTAKSRKAYQDFFALWKDADTDIPILIEAKKEYERLK